MAIRMRSSYRSVRYSAREQASAGKTQ
jgi:hypothetical protein